MLLQCSMKKVVGPSSHHPSSMSDHGKSKRNAPSLKGGERGAVIKRMSLLPFFCAHSANAWTSGEKARRPLGLVRSEIKALHKKPKQKEGRQHKRER